MASFPAPSRFGHACPSPISHCDFRGFTHCLLQNSSVTKRCLRKNASSLSSLSFSCFPPCSVSSGNRLALRMYEEFSKTTVFGIAAELGTGSRSKTVLEVPGKSAGWADVLKNRVLKGFGNGKDVDERLSMSVSASQPALYKRGLPMSLAAGIGVAAAACMMVLLGFLAKRPDRHPEGSVSDLVKRGQLRSDRNIDSKPLKYEDPFNNPMVKGGTKNPIVRMCGKIFRLTPITLTEEKVASHQNRRIQAYQWRRPIVFLNEGDPVPEGVDPEEVRWIPSNHPFATTRNYIDEEAAQKNVYQTRGVPSRVRAEHEALRKKMLEATQRGGPGTEPMGRNKAESPVSLENGSQNKAKSLEDGHACFDENFVFPTTNLWSTELPDKKEDGLTES